MKRLALLLATLIGLSFATIAHAQGPTPPAQEIYKKLYCPLCAGIRLDTCELKVCDDMRALVDQKLAAGESEQQIINYFVEQFGPQVLGYPPAEGFNLLAYVLPALGVAVGGSIAGYALWNWNRRRRAAVEAETIAVPAGYRQRIERELKELE